MAWRCFIVRETGEAVISLRRFVFTGHGKDCTPWPSGYVRCHTASVAVGRAPMHWDIHDDGRKYIDLVDKVPWLIDHRWPKTCEVCGYEFVDEDQWQVNQEPIYRADDGREFTQESMPIGAMFECGWMAPQFVGPDGKCWTVKLPPGKKHDVWHIDGPANNYNAPGPAWQRTGEAPDFVVTPSIAHPGYHGFLGSNTAPGPGWLSDPL